MSPCALAQYKRICLIYLTRSCMPISRARLHAMAGSQRPIKQCGSAGADARIKSLDVLLGVGVLGMLTTHIQLFMYPGLTRWNPTAYGELRGVNWWLWLATSVLADGKFIALFAMLLGPSIVMLPSRAGDRAMPA